MKKAETVVCGHVGGGARGSPLGSLMVVRYNLWYDTIHEVIFSGTQSKSNKGHLQNRAKALTIDIKPQLTLGSKRKFGERSVGAMSIDQGQEGFPPSSIVIIHLSEQ